MKLFNKILFTLISLFVFTASAFSETVADLSTSGRASFVARSGNALTIGTAGTDRLNFIVNNTVKAYIDSTGLNASSVVLTNPTISDNLTFSTATAKVIPGATSLTFRNNADSADNLSITDAGLVTFRSNLVLPVAGIVSSSVTTSLTQLSGGTIASSSASARISLYGSTEGSVPGNVYINSGTGSTTSKIILQLLGSSSNLDIVKSGGTLWTFTQAGTLSQDATNGGNIVFSKAGSAVNWSGTPGYLTTSGTNKIEFQTNSSTRWVIDGTTGTLTTPTSFGNDIGWTLVAGANTACNTTCSTGCVVGQETTSKAFLACTDATADLCLCAGAS